MEFFLIWNFFLFWRKSLIFVEISAFFRRKNADIEEREHIKKRTYKKADISAFFMSEKIEDFLRDLRVFSKNAEIETVDIQNFLRYGLGLRYGSFFKVNYSFVLRQNKVFLVA